MNKSNKLLIGILAFVVVCVIGYALFSETITVTGTAMAKGNFDIKVTNVDAAKMNEVWGYKDIGIINTSNININDNVVTGHLSNYGKVTFEGEIEDLNKFIKVKLISYSDGKYESLKITNVFSK